MRTPTIRDVAKRAGVGIGTVSRVLNGSTQVREETRERVLAAIRELNFSPNAAARQLSGGRTFTIGVVTPFFTYPSFVERLSGIQEVLDHSEYDLVLYSIRSQAQLQDRLRFLVGQRRADGLIVLSLRFDDEDLRLLNPDLPLIAVDNDTVQRYPRIVIDNEDGGRLATEYLIAHGHRAIGFIGEVIDSAFGFTPTRHRMHGFREALAAAGLAYHAAWCRLVSLDQESARQAAREILSQNERPTAFFVAMDMLAFGVLAAAEDMGLRVPDDVAVMGFDDIQAARYLHLTTVRQHLIESGRLASQHMLDWLSAGHLGQENQQIKLPLEIVERATV